MQRQLSHAADYSLQSGNFARTAAYRLADNRTTKVLLRGSARIIACRTSVRHKSLLSKLNCRESYFIIIVSVTVRLNVKFRRVCFEFCFVRSTTLFLLNNEDGILKKILLVVYILRPENNWLYFVWRVTNLWLWDLNFQQDYHYIRFELKLRNFEGNLNFNFCDLFRREIFESNFRKKCKISLGEIGIIVTIHVVVRLENGCGGKCECTWRVEARKRETKTLENNEERQLDWSICLSLSEV